MGLNDFVRMEITVARSVQRKYVVYPPEGPRPPSQEELAVSVALFCRSFWFDVYAELLFSCTAIDEGSAPAASTSSSVIGHAKLLLTSVLSRFCNLRKPFFISCDLLYVSYMF